MKRTFTLLATLLTLNSFAQKYEGHPNDQYSLEINYGFNAASNPSVMNFGHLGVGFRYMFDRNWGIMFDYGQDTFRENTTPETGTNYKRYSFQAVNNLGRTIGSETMDGTRIGLLAHGGIGYSSLHSLTLPGTDNIMHAMIGFTPQYKLSNSFALNFDITMVLNFTQHFNYQGLYPNGDGPKEAFTGRMVTASAGISYYFGGGKGRADWKPE